MKSRQYEPHERRAMARIWVEEGANAHAMPKTIARIRDELGIHLPENTGSLRRWSKHFHIRKPAKSVEIALPGFGGTPSKEPEIIGKLMPLETFQENLQIQCGAEMKADNELLQLLRDELRGERIKTSIKAMTVDQLIALRRSIEEGQQKRERHLLTLTGYIDLKNRKLRPEQDEIDRLILADLEKTDAVENQ